MAKENYKACLQEILKHEGGYVNHPSDPGGETNFGITQAVYTAWLRKRGKAQTSVKNITTAEVRAIYDLQYWDLVRGDQLPAGVDLAIFDYAVNSGAAQAVKEVQRILGLRADGDMAARTLDAINDADPHDLVEKICDARLAFMRRLKTWSTFGKGWTRRVNDVRRVATGMAGAATVTGFAGAAVLEGGDGDDIIGRADPRDVSAMSTDTGRGVGTAGVGAAGTAIADITEQIEPLTYYSDYIRWAFLALLIVGVGLTAYAFWRGRKQEALV